MDYSHYIMKVAVCHALQKKNIFTTFKIRRTERKKFR